MERIAFHIPFLNWPITWYGLMIATGFMAGYGIMIWRARQLKFPLERVADVVFTAVLSGLVGARVLYVITYWQRDFSGRPITDIFAIHRGGLVFYGGFFGGAIAMIILCRIKKLSLPTVVDLCALGLPLAHMFGRFGCFLNGCCHGRFTTGSLGFRYPIHEITPGGVAPPYSDILFRQIGEGKLTAETLPLIEMTGKLPDSGIPTHPDQLSHFLQIAEPHFCLPVIPVQLFNSLRNIITFFVLLLICRKIKRPGQLASIFLVLYGVGRFITEFWRGDYTSEYFLDILTPAQLVGLFVIPIGIGLYIWSGKREPQKLESAE